MLDLLALNKMITQKRHYKFKENAHFKIPSSLVLKVNTTIHLMLAI